MTEPHFIVNRDQLVAQRIIADVREAHAGSDALATLVLIRDAAVDEYGVVICDDDGRIAGFVEQPR